jgi:hypothetical protein
LALLGGCPEEKEEDGLGGSDGGKETPMDGADPDGGSGNEGGGEGDAGANQDAGSDDDAGGNNGDGGLSEDAGTVGVDGCPAGSVGIDPSTETFGLTSTTAWVALGGGGNSQLPGGANTRYGLVTATRCGIFALADNNQKYDGYLSSGGAAFKKISTTSSDGLYVGREGLRGSLQVVGDTIAWVGGTTGNKWRLWTMPLAGGPIAPVKSSEDTDLQIYGWVVNGDTSYFLSNYGQNKFNGLRSVATSKLLDGTMVSADTTEVRAGSPMASSYLLPYGAGKLLSTGTIVDLSCTSTCSDEPIPAGNTVQGSPYSTVQGDIVHYTYAPIKLAALTPGGATWAKSSEIVGMRLLHEVAFFGGKGVASYDVNNVEGDEVLFFSRAGDVLTTTKAPAGVTGSKTGVWTNGKVALVYQRGSVYGILLE